eukprot:221772-Heterocapsa_arctica.AAC.1
MGHHHHRMDPRKSRLARALCYPTLAAPFLKSAGITEYMARQQPFKGWKAGVPSLLHDTAVPGMKAEDSGQRYQRASHNNLVIGALEDSLHSLVSRWNAAIPANEIRTPVASKEEVKASGQATRKAKAYVDKVARRKDNHG